MDDDIFIKPIEAIVRIFNYSIPPFSSPLEAFQKCFLAKARPEWDFK